MKFEDLKLPVLMKSPGHIFWSQKHIEVAHEHAKEAARAVYDQMHAYYEAKLTEAKPEPEELFEHPNMPGKKFRRLGVGEEIREGDWTNAKTNPLLKGWGKTVCDGCFVEHGEGNFYYREVPQPAPNGEIVVDDLAG